MGVGEWGSLVLVGRHHLDSDSVQAVGRFVALLTQSSADPVEGGSHIFCFKAAMDYGFRALEGCSRSHGGPPLPHAGHCKSARFSPLHHPRPSAVEVTPDVEM